MSAPLPHAAEPLRYEPSHESLEDDESKTTQELKEALHRISETVHKDEGHAYRSVHAKSHGLLLAELKVLDGLPERLAQGLFAKPGTYPVAMRFSTTPGDLLDDAVSTPRGVALKVVGVEGDRVSGSEGDVTQDFVMVNGPVFSAPTAKAFLRPLKLLAATTDKAPGLKKVLSAALRGLRRWSRRPAARSPRSRPWAAIRRHTSSARPSTRRCRCSTAPTWPSCRWRRCRPSWWRWPAASSSSVTIPMSSARPC